MDRWRRLRAKRALLGDDGPEPTLEAPRSQPVTRAQFRSPEYARLCAWIGERSKLHRKQWEYVYVLRCLELGGCLRAGQRGLAFGVGREPLVAAIAARGPFVLATDQPPRDAQCTGWTASGEYAGALDALNARALCPPADFAQRVEFAFCDMRALESLEGPFDFLWSSCALEHLGSLDAGLDFVTASLSLLRPGGLAVHTTELNASSAERTITTGPVVLYRRRDLESLRTRLLAAGHDLELTFHRGDAPEDRAVDVPPYQDEPHLKVLYGTYATTSFGLCVRRGI